MRRTVTFMAFVTAVFVLSASLAPPVFLGVQWLGQFCEPLRKIDEQSFPRFVSRTVLIVALAGIWPLLRFLRPSREEFGVKPPEWNNLLRGLTVGLLTLGAFVLLGGIFGARFWRHAPNASTILRAVGLSLGSAIIVAPLEEFIFRGALFGLLRREMWWPVALLGSSVFFALVHFMQTPAITAAVDWNSGFAVLAQMVRPAGRVELYLTQLMNLTLCGLVLGWAFQRTASLWFPVGLHAGWIAALKVSNILTIAPQSSIAWGTRKIVDGWGASLALCAAAVLMAIMTSRERKKTNATANTSTAASVG